MPRRFIEFYTGFNVRFEGILLFWVELFIIEVDFLCDFIWFENEDFLLFTGV